MAIEFATVGAVATGDGVTSLASNAPSGVAVGDLLVLCVGAATPIATITTPTGWNARQNVADGFSAIRGALFDRIATGGGDDTPTVSFGGSTDVCSVILRITGNTASPFDTSDNTTQTGGTTVTLPDVVTTEDGELLVAVGFTDGADVNSDPSGWTMRANNNNTGSVVISMRVWTKSAPTAGTYGAETYTIAFTNQAVSEISAYKAAAGAVGGNSQIIATVARMQTQILTGTALGGCF